MSMVHVRPAAFFLLLAFVLPATTSAQLPVTGSAELTYKTKYFFAGIPFAEKEVTQAHVQVGVGSFTVHGFSTYDQEASDLTELDLYGDYYVQLAPTVGGFVGAALYGFKFVDGWKTTPELYAGLVFAAPLNPTLYVAHDFDLGDGTHVMLTVSEEVPLGTSGATLGLGANLDYNDSYWESFWLVSGSESGFSFADFTVSIGVPIGPLSVKPMVIIQRAIHEDFEDKAVFGVSASLTF